MQEWNVCLLANLCWWCHCDFSEKKTFFACSFLCGICSLLTDHITSTSVCLHVMNHAQFILSLQIFILIFMKYQCVLSLYISYIRNMML